MRDLPQVEANFAVRLFQNTFWLLQILKLLSTAVLD